MLINTETGKPATPAVIMQSAREVSGKYYARKLTVSAPSVASDFLARTLQPLEHEVFSVMFLDNRHGLIEYKEIFRGTIDGSSVHPREVVKLALQLNAAAVVLAHNHPSGIAEPSAADIAVTKRLVSSLALVDVRVLDHIIIGETAYSFAEHGLI